MASPSVESGVAFLQHRTQQFDGGEPQTFDATALSLLRNMVAEDGKVTCELPVTPAVQNVYGTLHGGCIGGPGGWSWP